MISFFVVSEPYRTEQLVKEGGRLGVFGVVGRRKYTAEICAIEKHNRREAYSKKQPHARARAAVCSL
jgi:hypothetical protein